MHARKHLDQGRLAGAVVADEGNDLARMDVEIDVGERRNGAEILGDAAQAEHHFARRRFSVNGFGHSRHAFPIGLDKGNSGRAHRGRNFRFISYPPMPSFLQPSA